MPKPLLSWLKPSSPPRWTPPPHIYYERKPRLAQRSSLLELRTQVSNQLHALSVVPIVVPAVSLRFKQLIETINQQIAQLDAELLELVKVEQESGERPAEEGQQIDRIEQKWKAAIALEVGYSRHWTAHGELAGGRNAQFYLV